MPKKKLDRASFTDKKINKRPVAEETSTLLWQPSWRIGNLDLDGKWGLSSLLGKFRFSFSDELFNEIEHLSDERLVNAFEELNGKEFDSIDIFWSKFKILYDGNISVDVVKSIHSSLTRNAFFEKIYPKLQAFEDNTWNEILGYTHGRNGKSNSHHVSTKNLSKEAQNRLETLKLSDTDSIFSLRLDGMTRIYGLKDKNCLDIIWIDTKHEIYPVYKE